MKSRLGIETAANLYITYIDLGFCYCYAGVIHCGESARHFENEPTSAALTAYDSMSSVLEIHAAYVTFEHDVDIFRCYRRHCHLIKDIPSQHSSDVRG